MRKGEGLDPFETKPVRCLNDKEANIKGNNANWATFGYLNVCNHWQTDRNLYITMDFPPQ